MDSAEQCRGRADLWKHTGFCRAHGRNFGTLSALWWDRLTDGKAPSRLFGGTDVCEHVSVLFLLAFAQKVSLLGTDVWKCGSSLHCGRIVPMFHTLFSDIRGVCQMVKKSSRSPQKEFFLCWCTKPTFHHSKLSRALYVCCSNSSASKKAHNYHSKQ